MKKGCKFLSKCPFWDMSSSGCEWCISDPIGTWERCPRPNKRDCKIEKIKAKKARNLAKRNGLRCHVCQTLLDGTIFRVLVPGLVDDCSSRVRICETCFLNKRY